MSKKQKSSGKLASVVIAVVVVGVIVGALAAMWTYDEHRNVHRITRAAHFTPDGHVILVRPSRIPIINQWTYDLWWVSLKTERVVRVEQESAENANVLEYWGAMQDAIWFWAPYNRLYVHPAGLKSARKDLSPFTNAHPELRSRLRFHHADEKSLIVTSETGKHFRIFSDGKIAPLEPHYSPQHTKFVNVSGWDLARVGGEVSLEKVTLAKPGVAKDHAFRTVRPKEGGYVVIGTDLQPTMDETNKDVVMRLDDKGNPIWTIRLADVTTSKPEVGRFHFGQLHIASELRGVHTTPGRVWIAYEMSHDLERQTRILEVDSETGRILRNFDPRL